MGTSVRLHSDSLPTQRTIRDSKLFAENRVTRRKGCNRYFKSIVTERRREVGVRNPVIIWSVSKNGSHICQLIVPKLDTPHVNVRLKKEKLV